MKIADPVPLGLFSFALTCFVISCYNAGIFGISATDPINVIVTLGVFYGGIVQTVAGILGFLAGDIFAATAFTSYGAFWLSYVALFIPGFGIHDAYAASDADVLRQASAVYLLGWTLFTGIILVVSIHTTTGLCTLFAMLVTTFALLTAGLYHDSVHIHRAGGFMGVFTAVVAWYNALAGLLANMPHPIFTLPVGAFRQKGEKDDEA